MSKNKFIEPGYNKKPMGFKAGKLIQYTSKISLIMSNNPSALTFEGTCTFIIGEKKISIIDPGPALNSQYKNIKKYLKGRELENIFVTHTHNDHSPLAKKLKSKFGGKIYAYDAHPKINKKASKHNHFYTRHDGDSEFCPDVYLKDLEQVEIESGIIQAQYTPGHISNHLCYSYKPHRKESFHHLNNLFKQDCNGDNELFLDSKTPILFSGDHVMGWSSTVVIPPHGNMEEYINSLKKLKNLPNDIYLPAHGRPIFYAKQYVGELLNHRYRREEQIIEFLAKNNDKKSINEIVKYIYPNISPKLKGAASLTIKAHLDFLVKKQIIQEIASFDNNFCYIIR